MRAIGVDLHKDLIVACFLEEDGAQQTARFRPSTDGLRAFRARLRPDDRLAVEAGRNVWYFLGRVADAVEEAVVVDPRRFAPIAESKKKTDARDALELARALRAGYLPTVPIPDERIIRLRQLFAARDTLVKTATQYKNLAHAALARNGVLSRRADLASARGRERLARVEGDRRCRLVRQCPEAGRLRRPGRLGPPVQPHRASGPHHQTGAEAAADPAHPGGAGADHRAAAEPAGRVLPPQEAGEGFG
jgi:hypothetical protein